jgi:LacI family transcriptional regulator
MSIATTARRLKGYHAALDNAGIARDPDLLAVGKTGGIDVGWATLDLLNTENPPTALFSSNARCSVDIVPTLQSLKRTDVALISFGDFPLAAALQPPLTVIDQDPDAIGRLAADRLFERIEHPNRRLKRQIVLPVSLVRRASCCTQYGQASSDWQEIRCILT